MLCEKCKKNIATTHIRSIVNGKKTEMHLCAECAAKEGISGINDAGLGGMLASMFGDVLSLDPAASLVKCDCCGSTFHDISKTGKAGCPQCYKTFYNEFLPYLKRVHGSIRHVGKTLHAPAAEQEPQNDIMKLKNELAELVREEKFEQAAEVRDKIKELEAGA